MKLIERSPFGSITFGIQEPGFVCYYYFIDWWHISLGFHICLSAPNIELHLPFGFIRIGVPSDKVWRKHRRNKEKETKE